MAELKLLSFNCRGLGSQQKRRDVLDHLRNLHYDIYLLQDTHLTKQKESFFNTLWRGKCYHAFGTFNSRGTSILFSPRINHKIIHVEYFPDGNCVILVCKMFEHTYTIVNVYGPNDDQPSFFTRINEIISHLPDENVIVGGDFNFVLDLARDSNYSRQNNPRAKDTFMQLTIEQGLIDAWTEKNPGMRAFTWAKQNPFKTGRLDMFFFSEHLNSQVTSSSITAGYRSDHSIITLHMSVPQKKRGPGLWKFNDSLLEDDDYDKAIKELIFENVLQYAVPIYNHEFISDPVNFGHIQFTISDHLFYETLLIMVRGETVKYAKRKARRLRDREDKINLEINQIQSELQANANPENLRRLEDAQQSLEDLRKPKIQGFITRSRVKWFEEGEKCTKYFLSLEKRNAIRNTIQSIKIDGHIVTDKEKILQHFSENLKKKYTKGHVDAPHAYLEHGIFDRLSDEERETLEETISIDELKTALMGMKKGKTPGSNGFTAEFLKHFWPFIGSFLYRAWLEQFQCDKNINSHNEGIVTLIPKAGKPQDSQKGWRPISLLNVDFKIISTAVANRIKTVIYKLISPAQTAYVKGRFIGENTRLLYDVIEHLNNTSSSGIIMAVDFEAAFDTVSWEFLLATLDKYNFGPYFKKLISVLYLSPDLNSRILLEGYLGPKVHMGRGIRQGDPVSGYLFNLIVEPLANKLKSANGIEGVAISPDLEARVSQYADDLVVFSGPADNSIIAVLDELTKFSDVSGLKTNVEKTKCLAIGKDVNKKALSDLGLNVVNDLKILGILFSESNKNITDTNFATILPNIEKDIAQWRRRNLSLIGKITVVKSLLVSKLVHVMSALPNPSEDLVKKLNNILFRFIWNNGPDKIKRSALVQAYKDDGLKMLHVQSFLASLKASWLKRLYWADSGVLWAKIVKKFLPPIERLLCFGSLKLKVISKNMLNVFWKEVLDAWADFSVAYKPEVD